MCARRASITAAARRVRRGRKALWALLFAVAACGDGGGGSAEGWLTVWGPTSKTTADATIILAGDAFVPRGAGCTYYTGPWAPPGCLCELGEDARLVWKNRTNGAGGGFGPAGSDGSSLGISGSAAPACRPAVWWRVPDVPLAPGVNLVDVTVSDGQASGSIQVTVTRN